MLEWQRHVDQQCGGCGQPLVESTRKDLEGAYEVSAVACHACAARERGAKKFTDTDGLKLAVHMLPAARDLIDGRADG